jgi:predicted small lipoprotein YifL
MKKLLFLCLSIMLITSGCGKYGKLKLPSDDKPKEKILEK